MSESLPILLIPGLGTSPRTYSGILPALWRHGCIFIADHTRDNSMQDIAARILKEAPPRFALIGHSMGGYIAFEILRQAHERVVKLALMNSSARPDTDEGKEKRKGQIAKAQQGKFDEIIEAALPGFLHASRKEDNTLRRIIIEFFTRKAIYFLWLRLWKHQ